MINELPIAILGFGKTGVSVAEYLHKKNKHFYVFENNETVEKLNQFNSLSDASKNKIFFGNFDRTELYKVQYIVQSPGIALSKKIKDKISKNNIKIVSDIDIFMKNYKSKVIAITGSNGKTTVTELLNYVLNKLNYKSVSCGNNGIPILSIEHYKYDYICLEVSSYQLEIS
ncbi:MAG: Mur ligase family protein, partial [Pseudomonadota bacterium]|nr:Mur ligase family protein [Pseudomonadota bacterium]